MLPSELVTIIRASLEASVGSVAAAAASADYSRLCRAASVRVRRVGDLLAAGLVNQALWEAWQTPILTDHVGALEFPERAEWRAFCVLHQLMLADDWDAGVVRKLVSLEEQGLPRGHFFYEHFHSAMSRQGVSHAMSVLGLIARLNPQDAEVRNELARMKEAFPRLALLTGGPWAEFSKSKTFTSAQAGFGAFHSRAEGAIGVGLTLAGGSEPLVPSGAVNRPVVPRLDSPNAISATGEGNGDPQPADNPASTRLSRSMPAWPNLLGGQARTTYKRRPFLAIGAVVLVFLLLVLVLLLGRPETAESQPTPVAMEVEQLWRGLRQLEETKAWLLSSKDQSVARERLADMQVSLTTISQMLETGGVTAFPGRLEPPPWAQPDFLGLLEAASVWRQCHLDWQDPINLKEGSPAAWKPSLELLVAEDEAWRRVAAYFIANPVRSEASLTARATFLSSLQAPALATLEGRVGRGGRSTKPAGTPREWVKLVNALGLMERAPDWLATWGETDGDLAAFNQLQGTNLPHWLIEEKNAAIATLAAADDNEAKDSPDGPPPNKLPPDDVADGEAGVVLEHADAMDATAPVFIWVLSPDSLNVSDISGADALPVERKMVLRVGGVAAEWIHLRSWPVQKDYVKDDTLAFASEKRSLLNQCFVFSGSRLARIPKDLNINGGRIVAHSASGRLLFDLRLVAAPVTTSLFPSWSEIKVTGRKKPSITKIQNKLREACMVSVPSVMTRFNFGAGRARYSLRGNSAKFPLSADGVVSRAGMKATVDDWYDAMLITQARKSEKVEEMQAELRSVKEDQDERRRVRENDNGRRNIPNSRTILELEMDLKREQEFLARITADIAEFEIELKSKIITDGRYVTAVEIMLADKRMIPLDLFTMEVFGFE